MSRPLKKTVDYFPHMTKQGKTLFILQERWGNDGYAFWFKLLEILGATDDHVYNLNIPDNKEYLYAYCKVDTYIGDNILNKLADLGAIDAELYAMGLIWSQNFVDNLRPLYGKRQQELPERPVSAPKTLVSGVDNTQSKVKYSKVEKSKVKYSKGKEDKHRVLREEIISDFNEVFSTKYKPTSQDIKGLINARVKEGHTMEDFMIVHRNMKRAWGNDPERAQFLRPQTLYTGKFSSYLNRVMADTSISSIGKGNYERGAKALEIDDDTR